VLIVVISADIVMQSDEEGKLGATKILAIIFACIAVLSVTVIAICIVIKCKGTY